VGKSDLTIPGFGDQSTRSCRDHKSLSGLAASVTRRTGIFQDETIHALTERRRSERSPKKPLVVMKFGGTSVGDASCIRRVVEIVRAASRASNVVVVVSAMSGVTNKLLEAASQAEAGNGNEVAAILEGLNKHHVEASRALISSPAQRDRLDNKVQDIFHQADHLCQGTILLRELTQRARDSISGLGERISAPLVAAALAERGTASEAIDATELVVTDSYHGAAEPLMDQTRLRCEARLLPLLRQGITPVVTGFIATTPEGVLTTLGRGGSDYSATILGAALGADEVVIWTDVDGVLTADPRLVTGVCTLPEISYREAAELSFFGAKVLHPKTLRPVMQSDIPVWIRNTFRPDRPGTRITPKGSPNGGRVKALTAINDVALITVGGPGIVGVRDVLGRTFTTTAAVRADVLLISQSSSQNDICFLVPAAIAARTVDALRREFAQDLAHEKVEHITLDTNVAIVAVVGEKMRGTPGIVGRTFSALGRENVSIIAIAQGSSECNISFVVAQSDMKAALLATHREFGLGAEFAVPSDEMAAKKGATPEPDLVGGQMNEANLGAGAD
jgi:bifunctional aspartokinase / homoserine dehydrogenase 1